MSNLLRQACIECVADAGKEDDALVKRLYDYMYENYESKSKLWNYEIIDELIKKWNEYVEFRNLDEVYFRVKRNKRYISVCFSDLTEEEMNEVMKNRDIEWLKNMCKIMAKTIRNIGDQLDITGEDEEEE